MDKNKKLHLELGSIVAIFYISCAIVTIVFAQDIMYLSETLSPSRPYTLRWWLNTREDLFIRVFVILYSLMSLIMILGIYVDYVFKREIETIKEV